MRELHCDLINATLTGIPLRLEGVTEEEWQNCFELALQQQVLAMTFPTMAILPKEQRPGFLLWSKWMAYAQSTAEQSRHKQEVVRKMGEWLAEEGLSTLIVKGFSLAVLYPNSNLREFCDVDIYSGEDYEKVNACFEKHGLQIGRSDSHHVHINIDCVSVEHHFALHNSRVKNGMEGPTGVLQQHAATDRRPTSLPGICFPNPTFTALFTAWHAHKHFLAEKIELRHVIDWALSLRQLSDTEARTVHEVKYGSSWGRFADTLTAIALHRLQLPKDWFPQKEVEAAEAVTKEQEQRVWDDIITAPHNKRGVSSYQSRINIGKRMMKNRWKFRTYAEVSAERFLWEEFVGYIRNRKA